MTPPDIQIHPIASGERNGNPSCILHLCKVVQVSERLDVLSQPTCVSNKKRDHWVDAKNHGFPFLQYRVPCVWEKLVKHSKSRFRVHFALASRRQWPQGHWVKKPHEFVMNIPLESDWINEGACAQDYIVYVTFCTSEVNSLVWKIKNGYVTNSRKLQRQAFRSVDSEIIYATKLQNCGGLPAWNSEN